MSGLKFALITETRFVTPSDLYRMSVALEACAAHCARAWSRACPIVDVCDAVNKLPHDSIPVVFVDAGTDMDAIGVHYYTQERGAAARVYVEHTSGLNTGVYSVSEAASHEINEATISPRVNYWLPYAHPHRVCVEVAVEVCDMVQDTFVLHAQGTDWQVANFVLPRWFDPKNTTREATPDQPYDHARRLRRGGAIGREGYVVLRAPAQDPSGVGGGYVTWLEDGYGPIERMGDAVRRRARSHAWARTKVRMGT